MENENSVVEKVVAIRKAFDSLMSKYNDDTGFVDSVSAALSEHELHEEKKIRDEYTKNSNLDRLLRIGIVGAVKAGKSSLLNALFFDGKDILPKAATPMTAALTELSYGEECKVTVDFFTEEDIDILKQRAEEYERFKKEIKKKKFDTLKENCLKALQRTNPDFKGELDSAKQKQLEEDANKAAERQANANITLAGAYQQYNDIKNSKTPRKTESETISVASVGELSGKLEDYVGSSGKYTPFTRSVSIELPIDSLKGVCIVDTPGFNDPVPSRDERARKALGDCNVILILSRAGQFLTENDKDVMAKITKKDGIRELYIIQSQIDSELFSNEMEDGDLDNAIKSIVSQLNYVVARNLQDINYNGVFDDLINDPAKRTFPTSGLCEAMSRTFYDKSSWDSGKKHLWEELKNDYPDYFSDSEKETSIASLKKLGNISPINSCINDVKERKEEIFQNALADFENKHSEKAKDIKHDILEYIAEREKELQERDIKTTESEIKQIQSSYNKIAPELEDAFIDTVIEWHKSIKSGYGKSLKDIRGEATEKVASAEGEYTRNWTKGHLWWKEYHSKQITTLNLSAVKSSIDEYIHDYNSELPNFLEYEIMRLTKTVMTSVQKVWTDANISLSEGNSLSDFRNKIRKTMSDMNFNYDVEYKGKGFEYERKSFGYNSQSTRLEGWEAEQCVDEARKFVSDLTLKFSKTMREAIDDVYEKCKAANFSKKVMDSYIKQLEKLKEDLEKPKLALENLSRIKKDVEAIEW